MNLKIITFYIIKTSNVCIVNFNEFYQSYPIFIFIKNGLSLVTHLIDKQRKIKRCNIKLCM